MGQTCICEAKQNLTRLALTRDTLDEGNNIIREACAYRRYEGKEKNFNIFGFPPCFSGQACASRVQSVMEDGRGWERRRRHALYVLIDLDIRLVL